MVGRRLCSANVLHGKDLIPSLIAQSKLPKTQKMVLDAALLNTRHYKVRIKGKVKQSEEWSSTLPYTKG